MSKEEKYELLWNNLETILERKKNSIRNYIEKEAVVSLRFGRYTEERIYEETIQLMKELKETDDDLKNDLNYKRMWIDLKNQVSDDLKFHESGDMQSISESVMGEVLCKRILSYIDKIEEDSTYVTNK